MTKSAKMTFSVSGSSGYAASPHLTTASTTPEALVTASIVAHHFCQVMPASDWSISLILASDWPTVTNSASDWSLCFHTGLLLAKLAPPSMFPP